MELWIRSQDKGILTKVEKLELIYDYLCSDEVQLIHIDSDKERLGSYSTKEKALEVLDEIQNLLKGAVLEKHINKFDIYNGENLKVYEMPEE